MAAGFGIRDSGFRLKKDFHSVGKLERQINKSRTHARRGHGFFFVLFKFLALRCREIRNSRKRGIRPFKKRPWNFQL
jgi:hypothetical protein